MLSPLRLVGLALGLLCGGSLLADPALETVSTNPPPDALAARQQMLWMIQGLATLPPPG